VCSQPDYCYTYPGFTNENPGLFDESNHNSIKNTLQFLKPQLDTLLDVMKNISVNPHDYVVIL